MRHTIKPFLHNVLGKIGLITYGYPVPVTENLLKENESIALNINAPAEKAVKKGLFWIDKSPASHKKEFQTLHAIDFPVPIGTDILAVEDGEIWITKDDSDIHGWGPEFSEHANYIAIKHKNRVVSEYIHIDKGSINELGLKTGDKVVKGQKIGKTGQNGRMDIPHLHFALYLDTKPKLVNIRIFFSNEISDIFHS